MEDIKYEILKRYIEKCIEKDNYLNEGDIGRLIEVLDEIKENK